jgi:DNA-binding response OmpR family regulator
VALVGAEAEEAADRLHADLRSLGWDVAPFRLERPDERPEGTLAVLPTSGALRACVRASEEIRGSASGGMPILWLVEPPDLVVLPDHAALFDDFLRVPYSTPELDARLRRLHAPGSDAADTIRVGRLEMDLAIYRASVDGRPLKLTYMEYELLRYLAARPGRIHTREAILRGVWGYDYYGGIRTVDVHVRRLRAKLGQEHARAIETVRGVGYGLTEGG